MAGRLFSLLNTFFLLILIITMIIPLLNTFAVSFSTNLLSMQPGIKLWPEVWSIEGYLTVWRRLQFWRPFLNNLYVTLVGTFFHVLLSSMAAYVLLRKDLPGRKWIVTFIMVTMMIPGEAIMIPLYVVNKDLHLINTLTSLIISGLVSGFSILLMRNYFLTVPEEMAESARIDGAGEFRIFSMLYLPLSASGLATVTLFEFVGRWNHFTSALLYINDEEKYTLQIALRSLLVATDSTSGSDFLTPNVRMAGIMLAMIPLFLVYPFVQRFFIKGILLGATKE